MTSFVSATYDTDKDQIFDPNFNSPDYQIPAMTTVDPVSGVITVNDSIDVDVCAYGVVADGTIIPGFAVVGSGNSGTVTATSDVFSPSDVGKRLCFHKGSGVTSMLAYPTYNGYLSAYIDPRTVTIALGSCPTLNTGSPSGIFGTDNGDALNAAVNALTLAPFGGVLQFPAGTVMAYGFKGARANSTFYATNAVVQPATPNGYYYKITAAGTSGGSIPTYPTTYGQTVVDGTATWKCMGRTTLVLPYGSSLRGRGRAIARPFGYVARGSVLMSCGYDANYALVLTSSSATNASQIQDITIDAHKNHATALQLNGSGGGNLVHNVALMRGTFATLDNSTGSATISACHVMGGYDPGPTIKTGGDSRFADCIIAGAGANNANVSASNVTDDFNMSGCHIYKGAWSANTPLSSLPGPNLLIESLSSGATRGGNVVGNTFDTAYGNHIEINISGASAAAIEALAITANQFYNPVDTVPTNTYSCINVTASATAPATGAIKALSITGNVAKGSPAGNQFKSFINWNLNAATQAKGVVVAANALDNMQALYTTTGAAYSPDYSAGNAWQTTAGVVTVG